MYSYPQLQAEVTVTKQPRIDMSYFLYNSRADNKLRIAIVTPMAINLKI
jgi:hypothetical protein